MKNPNNHDLHIMLTEIHGDVKSTIEKLNWIADWQKEHEEKDERRFNSLNKYATSIAIVASVIGGGTTWIYQKFTGKI